MPQQPSIKGFFTYFNTRVAAHGFTPPDMRNQGIPLPQLLDANAPFAEDCAKCITLQSAQEGR